MVRDYWMYRPDAGPALASLPGTRTVMDWFARYEQPDGLLKQLPWWSFIDWVPEGTIPTYDANGESCMTTLEYLGALEDAAALEQGLGDPQRAARYEAAPRMSGADSSASAGTACRVACRDLWPKRLQPAGQYSGRALRRGAKGPPAGRAAAMLVIDPGTTPTGILSASYYFRFYLARALEHAGMADEYLRSIDPWRKLLALHFSTWPEVPGERARTRMPGRRIRFTIC